MSEEKDNSLTDMQVIEESLPENFRELRKKIFESKKPEVDQYGDGFLAQAYFAARNSITGSYASIMRALRLDSTAFNYYMETYPDFVAAVNMGRIDANKERVGNLQNALLARAFGMEIEEIKEEVSGNVDNNGNIVSPRKKMTSIKKQIPPDTTAILESLRRIDPSWNPKSTIDINTNLNMDVTEDVNINVDLRELSPEALREILGSRKPNANRLAFSTEDGVSVKNLNNPNYEMKRRGGTKGKKLGPRNKPSTGNKVTKKPLKIEVKPEGQNAEVS